MLRQSIVSLKYFFSICIENKLKNKFYEIMLKSFSGLTQQLVEKPFRSMLYGVYNMADEDRYIVRYRSYGYDTDIDSFECMVFDVNDIENNELVLFKKYIESEIQKDKTVIGIILSKTSKGKYNLIAIKPKSIEVSDIIKNV